MKLEDFDQLTIDNISNWSWSDCRDHSLNKWKYVKEIVESKQGVVVTPILEVPSLVLNTGEILELNFSTCALCQKVLNQFAEDKSDANVYCDLCPIKLQTEKTCINAWRDAVDHDRFDAMIKTLEILEF